MAVKVVKVAAVVVVVLEVVTTMVLFTVAGGRAVRWLPLMLFVSVT